MKINGTQIIGTYAEAFGMKFVRLAITAIDPHWAIVAAREFSGYGTSVIGCDAEVAVEKVLAAEETFDGRPGVQVMAFGFDARQLEKAMIQRGGQTLMTCPTTAAFDACPDSEKHIEFGSQLRFFGDGFQKSKLIAERRLWRVPVMDGEFVVEDSLGLEKGVAGGNFIVMAACTTSCLAGATAAVNAIAKIDGCITPFPGGIARSGSKVGSRYPTMIASTAEAFCPTLKTRCTTSLVEDANCALEVVIDGESYEAVLRAMKAGIQAACQEDIVAISAGNYGGKLGKHHFHLHELLGSSNP